jgi:hypothetical protein
LWINQGLSNISKYNNFSLTSSKALMLNKAYATARSLALLILAAPFAAFAQNIAINNVALTEGDAGTVNFDFPVTLSTPAAAAITLNYSTGTAGTATSGTDFVAVTAGTITIPIGASAGVARVVVNSDVIVESQETFTTTISLQAGSPGTIVTNQALGQITNDDSAVLSIASVAQAEGNAAGMLSFIASLSRPVQGAVSVNVASADDSAVAPADYASINQVLNFASSTTSAPFTVASVGDNIVEPNERFALNLTALSTPPSLAASISLSTAAIFGTLNNDDSAAISVNAPSQLEGNAGNSAMPFNFTLSAPVQGVVSFSAASMDGTATLANSDYQAFTGNITFAALSTAAQTANVNIVGDLIVEADENFAMNLTGLTLPAGIAAGSVTLAANTTGTIRNDDSTSVSIASAVRAEGNSGTSNLVFTVTLSAPSATNVTANFSTTPGTATASDFTATTGTVTFTPGQTSQSIGVPILGDTLLENDETFSLTLSAAAGATLGTAAAIGTIQNDDAVSLSISDARAPEGTATSPSTLSFTVNLTGTSALPVSVQFATQNGTAFAPSDYLASSGTLNFAVGETSKTIPISIIADSEVENPETFSVVLSATNPAAPNVTLNPAIGIGTIENDDAFVQVPGLNTIGMLLLGLLCAAMSLRALRT